VANVDPQEPVHFPPDIPGDGRQPLLPRRLPTRPALTRTQQRDDYVLLRQIKSEQRAEQRAQQRAHDLVDAPVRNITDQLLNVDNHQDVADYPQEPSVLGMKASQNSDLQQETRKGCKKKSMLNNSMWLLMMNGHQISHKSTIIYSQ